MDDRLEQWAFAITEIYRYWHRIAVKEMRRHGLKGAYAPYFAALCSHKEGLTPTQLAAVCDRDKSDVSRSVAALEDQGMIEKKSKPNRVYGARIVLTEKGKTIARDINRQVGVVVKESSRGLDEADKAAFGRVLDLAVANLHQMEDFYGA